MKNLLKIYIFTGLVLLAFQVKSQQLYQFSQYMLRPSLYNPAATGSDNALCVFAAGRNQWIGFKDEEGTKISPNNYLAGAAMPISSISSGVGLMLGYDKIGYQNSMNIRADYSYKTEIADGQFVSGGIALQISQITLDISKLLPSDPNDPLMNETGKQKDLVPEGGIGFLYSNKNKWWAGLSYMNMFGSTARLGNIEIQDKPALIAQGLYKINLVNERFRKIDLVPSMLVKTYFTKTQAELNVLGYLNDRVWLGTGYRFEDGVILLAGIQAENLKLGVSYDFTTNEVRKATGKGSAEVHLSYCIPGFSSDSRNNALNERPTSTENNWKRVINRNTSQKIKMRSMFNTRHL